MVTRHRVEWNEAVGQLPLGNGEFCFTADGTGLQTFGGNAMAHWGWHSFPLPEGWTAEQVPVTGTFQQGRCQGPDTFPPGTEAIRQWMIDNPHILNLGRLRLHKAGGRDLDPSDIKDLVRTLDPWTGLHLAMFRIDGCPVRVETCVHPDLDMIAIRIESPLVAEGLLDVTLDFPYPALKNEAWVGDFSRRDGHATTLSRPAERRADFRREADATVYHAALSWSAGASFVSDPSAIYRLSTRGSSALSLVCLFSSDSPPAVLPDFDETRKAAAAGWERFWMSGGAIDLSASRDPRWKELERRIVLSQYLLAAQSSGSWPPSESGLMTIDPWRGQFHMEMVWWHLAHAALWDRWDRVEKALECYGRFAPTARALAEQLGYKGLKWPKSVGPEGRSAPWVGNQVLLWKQPHPIFFAELEYRLRPGRATLEKWAGLIQGTAEHMADVPVRDERTGLFSLDSVMPPSELGITRDTVFDLAYWRWGLDMAQVWRERMGLPREPRWDEVRRGLAPLPEAGGVYVHSAEWADTYEKRNWEHPDPVGVLGMLPPVDGVDPETARRTAKRVWKTWQWDRTWGWDCPWMAMAAARTGQPEIAVEALLRESKRNRFDVRGANLGGPAPYLPGNGGLLYAVALMAAGWDGAPEREAPGFPADGSWVVRWEGLKRAP
jgi:hypothetical protein